MTTPHYVVLDVSDQAAYFALTQALREFADDSRHEARQECEQDEQRAAWLNGHADAADAMLAHVEEAEPAKVIGTEYAVRGTLYHYGTWQHGTEKCVSRRTAEHAAKYGRESQRNTGRQLDAEALQRPILAGPYEPIPFPTELED